MQEAKIEQTDTGAVPVDDGWFVLNLKDIAWETVEGGGTWCAFEARGTRDNAVGTGVHVLPPGESSGFYHAENEQEGFLVLSGECIAVVEGQERRVGPWDYLHCPPGTAHITIGTGDQPCAILMVGTRVANPSTIEYLPEPAAARHGAAVPERTEDPREAYKDRPPIVPARSPWPLR
jgi:uncharacterized cupin superfamily protein